MSNSKPHQLTEPEIRESTEMHEASEEYAVALCNDKGLPCKGVCSVAVDAFVAGARWAAKRHREIMDDHWREAKARLEASNTQPETGPNGDVVAGCLR